MVKFPSKRLKRHEIVQSAGQKMGTLIAMFSFIYLSRASNPELLSHEANI